MLSAPRTIMKGLGFYPKWSKHIRYRWVAYSAGVIAIALLSLHSAVPAHTRTSPHHSNNGDGSLNFFSIKSALNTSMPPNAKNELNTKDYWIVDLHRLSGEKGAKSQGAQDFYFEQIFKKTGTTNRYFVEFGFNEPGYTTGGSGANTWSLYDSGWRGLLLDGSRENAEINLHAHYLFERNIGSVLAKYEVPKDFDLLSCDMDSHDIFVLRGILKSGYRPRVFTTEYNANYPLEYAITLIDPTIIDADVSAYDFQFKQCAWGASASALRIVAEKFGYTLVGRVGALDLVWLRNDLIKDDWEVPAFEWFFKDAPLGELHHNKQTSDDIFEFLLDFDVLEKTGSVQKSKEAARVNLEPSGLACFNFGSLSHL